jgi:polar amino acid transport system substrate-binding protein
LPAVKPPARVSLIGCAALVVAGIAASGGSANAKPPAASATAKAAAGCRPAALKTHTAGVLTVATDSPAYPPYFEHNDPSNGKGFESAVAYAVAAKLGYTKKQVKWVVEPFDASYAPGPKSFDFDINEISITPARAKAVTFSTPYYTNPQGIVVAAGSPLAHARSLAGMKSADIGVQIGTTSLTAATSEIKPKSAPQIFNTSNDVVQAFKIHRVNAIVVDLATAFELISEIPHSTIAGQFSSPGGDHWGLLMSKGSPIASCVDSALGSLRSAGTLAKLDKRWIAAASSVPVLR